MKYVKITYIIHNLGVEQTNAASVTSIKATLFNLILEALYLYLRIETMVCGRDENGQNLANCKNGKP